MVNIGEFPPQGFRKVGKPCQVSLAEEPLLPHQGERRRRASLGGFFSPLIKGDRGDSPAFSVAAATESVAWGHSSPPLSRCRTLFSPLLKGACDRELHFGEPLLPPYQGGPGGILPPSQWQRQRRASLGGPLLPPYQGGLGGILPVWFSKIVLS